ncbi:MAG: pitrilysin family protein [Planctomycetota bacterium]
MKRCILAIAVVFLCASVVLGGDRRYPFEQIELDNGLKVVTLEDSSCPIVAVQVWYHVGSKDEDPGRQGFAHMFEHMMFRGTDRLDETGHFENIRRVGGSNNAYTAFDQTVYVQELPSNQLELVFWLEAERMAFLRVDQEGFVTERKVVCEELRQAHNTPYGRVPERLLAEIYGDKPYGWTPGGQIEHLLGATIDELQAFWDRFYVPNNAVLVVVGAVKHAEAQALAKKYFGWIPRCPDPTKGEVPPCDQKESRVIKLKEDKGPLPVVGVLYRTVPGGHPDGPALQVLMGVLGGGESSRLYVDVVKDKEIAQVAGAISFSLEDDGFAVAGGVLLPLVGDKKDMMQAIKRHIKRVTKEPITEAELDKMKNQMRRSEVEGALTVSNKASLLGQYAVLYGDAERINRQLAEIDAVTVEDVQRAAKKYLKKERRVSLLIEPSLGGMVGSLFGGGGGGEEEAVATTQVGENRVAKRTGPKAKAVRPEDFPAEPPMADLLDEYPDIPHAEKTLASGLKVVVVENHEVPMVWMTLRIKSGAWTEDKPGVASAAMGMLTQGTKTRDAKQMAEILESNAISLSGSADMDTAGIYGSALLPQLDLAMELLADVVENPTFPKDEFDLHQRQTRMGLMVSAKQPEYLAARELRQRMFGAHPYSRTATGELEDLNGVKIEDLKAWWAKNLRSDNAVMYVSGDIAPDAAFKLVEKHLGGWKAEGKFEPPPMAEIPANQATHIYVMDKPGSTQSQIRIGHIGIVRKDPAYFVSQVMGSIFGGSFNSRLNKAIRVEKGLTYGARGSLSAQRFAGTLTIGTFTKTASTAETVQTILDEIAKMQAAPPTAEELSDTKTYIVGSFPGDRETPSATVGDLWMIETQDLPEDYLQRYLAGVKKTTGDSVMQAAKSLIDPNHLIIVVVGEAEKIKADLERIAPVTVVGQAAGEDSEAPPAERTRPESAEPSTRV